ncbi:transporter [Pontibacillus salipaludis]|uniref:Transporter n=2 Tax=Pontibacillus salipaludis TaxID=1697394 RepID=A0ABQ1Q299_9BACI|nr:transporter [Pontibacillus salipaludis]
MGVPILLVIANIILLFLSENEVERKSYISKWDTPFRANLENVIEEEGVFQPSTEEYVYFDDDLGSFQQFVVEEGDQVDVGEPLYEYVVRDYYEAVDQLENQIEGLEEEVEALEDYVNEIEDIEVPEPEFNVDEEEEPSPFAEAEVIKSQSEAEARKELALKEAQLTALEDQLDEVEDRGEVIEVVSLFSGTVKKIDHSLKNPTVTISRSDELVIAGKIDERHRQNLQEGMLARGTIDKLEQSWEGQVQSADDFPVEGSSEDGNSDYSYVVELNESVDEALPGYHSSIYFTIEEVKNAVTVYQNWIHIPIDGFDDYVADYEPEDEVLSEEEEEVQETDSSEKEEGIEVEGPLVEGPYAWVMNGKGEVEKRSLNLGMDEYNLQEVKEGLAVEDWVADEPSKEFRDSTTFLTSLNLEYLDWRGITTLKKDVMWEYAKMGLLMR